MSDNINNLNKVIEYIEEHITEDFSYKDLSKIAFVDEFTLHKIFYFLANISLSEYIRKRRLTRAGIELQNSNIKVIDFAVKYGYDSPQAFTRAFYKIHEIKPSELKRTKVYLKSFPVIKFDNNYNIQKELNYKIKYQEELILYGKYIETNIENIKAEAPMFWKSISNDKIYNNIGHDVMFGIIEYDNKFPFPEKAKYYIATKEVVASWQQIVIPKSEYAIFKIDNISGEYMSGFSKKVYSNWIPYSGYNIKNAPELEVYYKNHTAWWLPIIKKSDFY